MSVMLASESNDVMTFDQNAQLVDNDGLALINFFIQDQKKLTAVDKFSRLHDADTPPLHEKYYRDLIPLNKPVKGEQYAFEVDMDACTGCKACVTACHSMNGLDDDEVWRTVGLLQGGTDSAPFFQMVTSACHHCAHPACMDGCPVKAYAKDEFTGIVKHLDDQCIGCQYCVLKCPYDVPKYNKKLGIVRKCDMCSSRLAASEAPACVQACPNSAIKIAVVNLDDVAKRAVCNEFLPGSPDADYTQPTTLYLKKNALPSNTVAADLHRATPEHSHLPLVFMLVLSQLSVGAFAIDWIMSLLSPVDALGTSRPICMGAAFLCGFFGLNAAILHLGRPLYAFRAVLGFRTSWMSREIVAFSAYLGAASGYAASFWLLKFGIEIPPAIVSALRVSTVVTGVLGVFCSMMIYIDTRRIFWKASQTAIKFGLSTVVLGLAGFLIFMTANASFTGAALKGTRPLCVALAAVAVFKMIYEAQIFRHLKKFAPLHPLKKSALLMARDLVLATNMRFTLGVIGGFVLPLMLLGPIVNSGVALFFASAIGATLLVSELLERYLFFRAVVALKMPGGSAA
jgi:formate dehydrogenase iron-sulfur subunit